MKVKFLVTVALLLGATAVFAAPVTITFTAFQAPNQWQLGSPYVATVNGVPGVWVMCDDWEHGGLPGQSWLANYTNLGTGNLSLLRFNQLPNALTLYQEVGWLLLETRVTPAGQTWTDINVAVWHILDSNAPLTAGGAYWLGQAQNEASLGFPGTNFSQVAVYTPLVQYDTNVDGPQELLTTVPEPGTLLLMAGGLAGLASRLKRK